MAKPARHHQLAARGPGSLSHRCRERATQNGHESVLASLENPFDGPKTATSTIRHWTPNCTLSGLLPIRSFIAFAALTTLLTGFPLPTRGDDSRVLISPLDPQGFAAPASVQWRTLLKQSFFFFSVQQSFRGATDADTRHYMGGSFLGGYLKSVSNLHGWSDGDPFVVNYVGHPIQGAIAGDIWIHNDLRFRNAEFGRNRQYWTSRLRAMAFAWAYSEQFKSDRSVKLPSVTFSPTFLSRDLSITSLRRPLGWAGW